VELALAVIGLVIGIISIIYAVKTNRDKAKLEKFTRLRYENFTATIEDAENNADSAYLHIEEVHRFLNGLKRSEELKAILDRAMWAQQDVAAAHRLLKRLKHDVVSLEKSMSGEEVTSHKLDSAESKQLKD